MSVVGKNDKFKILINILKDLSPCVLAFSGGVDSTFLAAAAQKAGVEFEAVTVNTPFIAEREINAVKNLVEEMEFKHKELELSLSELDKAAENTPERCYYCKKEVFRKIMDYAGDLKIIEGSNADDISDYRPGRKALEEMNIISPMLEAGLSKTEIRQLSKKMGISTWNKPSLSCLAVQISYQNQITEDRLEKIELAEMLMRRNGFNNFRVRMHGNLARIEIAEEERSKILDLSLMDKLSDRIKKLGFKYVTLDLSAYQSGSMNKEILEDENV